MRSLEPQMPMIGMGVMAGRKWKPWWGRGTSFGRSWRKHWFHLHRELDDESNIVLAFQKKIGEVATGELELTPESCVTAGEPGQPHSFNLRHLRSRDGTAVSLVQLAAASAESKLEWLPALKNAIEKVTEQNGETDFRLQNAATVSGVGGARLKRELLMLSTRAVVEAPDTRPRRRASRLRLLNSLTKRVKAVTGRGSKERRDQDARVLGEDGASGQGEGAGGAGRISRRGILVADRGDC